MPTPTTFVWLDGLLRGGAGTGDVTGPASAFVDNLVSFATIDGKTIKDSGVAVSSLIRANGSVAFAANQSMGSNKLTNLATPTNAGDAANKAYVDGLVGSAVTADGITLQLVTSVMSVKANGIGNSQLRSATAASVVGRAANSSGNVADIPVNEGETLVRTGGVLGSAKVTAVNIAAAAAIDLTQLANGSAHSLVGRGAASVGAYADIVAGTVGHIMRRDGSGLSFGTIDISNVNTVGTSKLPLANQPDGAACSIRGRSANSVGVIADIAIADNETLVRTAGVLVSAKITATNIAASAAIALTQLASVATDVLLGRDTAGTGAIEVITLNATLSMTGAGALQRAALTGDVTAAAGSNTTAIAAGVIVDADVNAAAAIAGSKVNPNFGAQNITTTGVMSLGATPASAGDLRVRHGFTLRGRNSANTDDRNIVQWGILTDYVILGASNAGSDTQLVGDSITIAGLQSTTISVAGSTVVSVSAGQLVAAVSGSVALGVTPSTAGFLRMPANSAIMVRNVANTANMNVIGVAADNQINVGDGTAFAVTLQAGAATFIARSTFIETTIPQIRFANNVVSPYIGQEPEPAAINGDTLLITAQDTAGATGGTLDLRSGTGATDSGEVLIKRGTTTAFATGVTSGSMTVTIGSGVGPITLSTGGAVDYSVYMSLNAGSNRHKFHIDYVDFDDASVGSVGNNDFELKYQGVTFLAFRRESSVSEIGFFGVTTVPKATDIGALTAAFGTADGTIADVGAAFSQATLNNNFQDLATKVNSLRTVLRNYGLMA
jgi:hypothetical protein